MSGRHDIVILGSGTTALAGAFKAAELGARVLMVEQSELGGTCVNWGCIPSKTLIAKAEARFEHFACGVERTAICLGARVRPCVRAALLHCGDALRGPGTRATRGTQRGPQQKTTALSPCMHC